MRRWRRHTPRPGGGGRIADDDPHGGAPIPGQLRRSCATRRVMGEGSGISACRRCSPVWGRDSLHGRVGPGGMGGGVMVAEGLAERLLADPAGEDLACKWSR